MSQPPSLLPPHDITASVDRLPDTVLSDTFLLVKSASTAWDHQQRTPFALACVSRRWRMIALSTPALWGYVNSLLPAKRVIAHLTRSRKVPVKLWLDIPYAKMNTATLEDVFRRLGDNIWARIRDLIVMLDYERPRLSRLAVDTLNAAFDAGHTGVFDEITVAVIADFWGCEDIEPSNELCLHLPNCQTLRILSLTQVDLSLKHLTQVSSLPLLQELSLERIYVGLLDLLFPLLNIVPNLVKLSLEACEFEMGSTNSIMFSPDTRFQLAKLEKLNLLKIRGLLFLNVLFTAIDMPRLRTLKFGPSSLMSLGDHFTPDINWSAVFGNINIEKLELGDFSPDVMEDLVTDIDKLVNLKVLQVVPDGDFKSAEFPAEFADKLVETSCCPILQDLFLPEYWRPDRYTWRRLEDLKRERPSLNIYVDCKEVECPEESDTEESDTEESGTEEGSYSEQETIEEECDSSEEEGEGEEEEGEEGGEGDEGGEGEGDESD